MTTFVTDKDLEKYKLNYRDISPTCIATEKARMWSKKEMLAEGIFFSYLRDKLPKGVKPRLKFLEDKQPRRESMLPTDIST